MLSVAEFRNNLQPAAGLRLKNYKKFNVSDTVFKFKMVTMIGPCNLWCRAAAELKNYISSATAEEIPLTIAAFHPGKYRKSRITISPLINDDG